MPWKGDKFINRRPLACENKRLQGSGEGQGGGLEATLARQLKKLQEKGSRVREEKGLRGSQIPWHVNTEGSISVAIKLCAKGQARV